MVNARVYGFFFAFRVALPFLFFPTSKNGFLLNGFLALVLLGCSKRDYKKLPLYSWLCAYLVWAAISLCWTPTPLGTSIGHWGLIAIDVLLAVTILDAEGFISGWIFGATALALLVPFLKFDEGRIGNEGPLNPHNLGPIVTLALLFALFRWRTNRDKKWIWAAALLFTALVVSGDKTDMVCAAISGSFLFGRWPALSLKLRLRMVAAALAVGLCAFLLMSTYVSDYLESEGIYTLTGRTLVWAKAVDGALEHPIVGNGFYASRDMLFIPESDFEAGHAHNEWLQVWLTLGIPGLLILSGIYWAFFRAARNSVSLRKKHLAYCLLIYALIHSIAEAPWDLSLPMCLILVIGRWLSTEEQTIRHSCNIRRAELRGGAIEARSGIV